MQRVEYKASVLPDGHLSCPENVKQRLGLVNGTEVKVIIISSDAPGEKTEKMVKRSVSQKGTGICGIWQDERDAEEIIRDIYSNRRGFKEIEL